MNFRKNVKALEVQDSPSNPLLQTTVSNVTGIHFVMSVWLAKNVDMFVRNCYIEFNHFILHEKASWNDTKLHLTKCHIGSIVRIYNANLTVENNTLSGATISDSPCILAINSTVQFRSSTVRHFQGSTFLEVDRGIAHLSRVTFSNCKAMFSIVGVTRFSKLFIDNCTFSSNNYSLVEIANSSLGVINHSIFKQNHIDTNVTMTRDYLIRTHSRSFLLIQESTFSNNSVIVGTVGTLNKSICVVINNCTFWNNRGRAVFIQNCFSVMITNCIFHSNRAGKDGAAFVIQSDEPAEREMTLDLTMFQETEILLDSEEQSTVKQLLFSAACSHGTQLILLVGQCHFISLMCHTASLPTTALQKAEEPCMDKKVAWSALPVLSTIILLGWQML